MGLESLPGCTGDLGAMQGALNKMAPASKQWRQAADWARELAQLVSTMQAWLSRSLCSTTIPFQKVLLSGPVSASSQSSTICLNPCSYLLSWPSWCCSEVATDATRVWLTFFLQRFQLVPETWATAFFIGGVHPAYPAPICSATLPLCSLHLECPQTQQLKGRHALDAAG